MENENIKNVSETIEIVKDEKPQRTASDVIVSIEGKLDTLIKVFSQLNFNTSLILDRSNKMQLFINKIEKQLEAEGILSLPVQDDKTMVKSPENPITIADHNVGVRRTSRAESYTNQSNIQPETIMTEPIQSVAKLQEKGNDKKIPCSQRITDQTGKDLYMASVEIYNLDGIEILKTKTNAAGKWQGYLAPGSYKVKINKIDMASKNKIEASQDIIVPNIKTAHTLPVAIIRK